MNTFKFSQKNPQLLVKVPRSKLKKYITEWGWNKLISGGKGEFIEDMVIDYIVSSGKFPRIVRSGKTSSCDFHLRSDSRYRIDIRRLSGSKNKSKNLSLWLGYTSIGKKEEPWTYKAFYLKRGGYLAVHFTKKDMRIVYFPATFLRNNYRSYNNYMSYEYMHEYFFPETVS